MGLFGSAVAYVLYYWLLRYLEASQLSAFTYLLPVLASILGILALGEKGSWTQVLGGTLAARWRVLDGVRQRSPTKDSRDSEISPLPIARKVLVHNGRAAASRPVDAV